jgi:uncharacterized protein (TIGR02246 family)
MVYRAVLSVVAILVFVSNAAAQSPAPQLLELDKQYTEALNARDAAKLAALYAEDAVYMPPDSPAVNGRQAIQQHYAGLRELPPFQATITPLASEVSGDLGYVQGQFTFKEDKSKGGTADVKGKYVVAYKRVNGQWKILYDIFNSDQRPAPPTPPTPPVPPTPPQ